MDFEIKWFECVIVNSNNLKVKLWIKRRLKLKNWSYVCFRFSWNLKNTLPETQTNKYIFITHSQSSTHWKPSDYCFPTMLKVEYRHGNWKFDWYCLYTAGWWSIFSLLSANILHQNSSSYLHRYQFYDYQILSKPALWSNTSIYLLQSRFLSNLTMLWPSSGHISNIHNANYKWKKKKRYMTLL